VKTYALSSSKSPGCKTIPVAVLDYSSAKALHYIETDHLGTPRVVIEQDRNLAVWIWPITGEAFGNTPPNEDPDGDGKTFTLDMRFPGQRYDSVSGLYYNYFRDYEPGTGRYTQSDPIGLDGGLSTYGYVEGNPFLYFDSEGTEPKYQTPPNPNKKPAPEHRQQSGERQRNIGHEKGEEHSRKPKGQRGVRGGRGARGIGAILVLDYVLDNICDIKPDAFFCEYEEYREEICHEIKKHEKEPEK